MKFIDKKNLFCNCDGDTHNQSEFCADPDMIITALEDAKDVMNYSNWANDKFDRAINIITQYCKDNSIPMRFVEGIK